MVSGSSRSLKASSPLFTSRAATLVFRLLRNIPFSSRPIKDPTPSMVLSITFPENPSATTTSQPPLTASLASMLPMKLR